VNKFWFLKNSKCDPLIKDFYQKCVQYLKCTLRVDNLVKIYKKA